MVQTATARTARESDRPSPSEKKRQRLLDAAARCFAEIGFVKTTVEEIARAAGVSKGLLYVHFESKEALLEAVLEATLQEWHRATWAAVEQGGSSAREMLATMHRASLEFTLNNPLLGRILERDAQLVRSLVEVPAHRAMEEWGKELRELVHRGVADGEFRQDLDIDRAATTIQLLHMSFCDRVLDDDLLQVNDTALIDTSIDLLLRGMSSGGTS